MSGKNFSTLFLMSGKICFTSPPLPLPLPLRSPTFLGKIVARYKNLLQGMIRFGRAILADIPRIKRGSFAPVYSIM